MQEKKGYAGALFIMAFITALLIFKVYLANETYYVSRDIQKITAKINALKEERNILQLKIEKLRYKNTISDPLFAYEPEEAQESVVESKEKEKKTEKVKSTKELFKNIPNEESYWLRDF